MDRASSSNSSEKPIVLLGTGNLTIEEVVGVARSNWRVANVGGNEVDDIQAQEAYKRVVESRKWVKKVVADIKKLEQGEETKAFYGINTGFGSKAGSYGLGKDDIPWVSRNLIVSHSTGVGEALHPEIVRAAMLIRANSLAQGYSGVSPELINTLVQMLNEGLCPVIPEHGSVGASGDLAPLSHLALAISKRPRTSKQARHRLLAGYDESGQAYLRLRSDENPKNFPEVIAIGGVKYAVLSGHEAMKSRGIEPLELGPKEGLAFNNGATFSAAIAALAIFDAENIARHAEVAAALSLEALLGFRDAFLPQIQDVRHHSGQIESARRILKIVYGSTILDGDSNQDPRYIPPQDPYSLRVTPQVIGAVWDVLTFLRHTITNEVNAATDNPLIFVDLPRSYQVVSGGNFHGAPLGYAMDFLGIVLTDLGSLSERRIFRLTDDKLSFGLPSMLIDEPRTKQGRTSGMMISQYLAAGLVSECKTLAHPDSVDSIPTSANQEDHVSMSMNAARHARKIVENIEYVVAIELLCASMGLGWRRIDLEKKKRGYEDARDDPEKKVQRNKKLPWHEREIVTRVDELVLYLRREKVQPKPGIGSQVALDVIKQALSGLPKLGGEKTAEDRYLRPYVLRTVDLLRSRELVTQVYPKCDLPHP